jgi:hypothetical protein
MKKGDEKYFCRRVFETEHDVRVNGRVISDHAWQGEDVMKEVSAAT